MLSLDVQVNLFNRSVGIVIKQLMKVFNTFSFILYLIEINNMYPLLIVLCSYTEFEESYNPIFPFYIIEFKLFINK